MSISELAMEKPEPKSATTKVGFVSLGCPKNLVDSEVMMGLLAASGAEITPDAEDADVIVVNTCSFIDTAKQESVNTILEMAQHKIRGPRTRTEADRRRMSGRALPQRDSEKYSGSRRGRRNRRARRHSCRRGNRGAAGPSRRIRHSTF